MTAPLECDKCKDLRDAKTSTLLIMCEDRDYCLKVCLCEYHCYEIYSLCRSCLLFIQDSKNDEAIKKWEIKYGIKRLEPR